MKRFLLLFFTIPLLGQTWVIVNPQSGTKPKTEIIELIEKKHPSYRIFLTESSRDVAEIAGQAVEEKVEVVAVVGGDGTIHEAASALIGTDTSLAIIPAGSGNGLARHLNIPLDPEKALRLIAQGETKKIDTVTMGTDSYLNVAGIGFDAHIGNLFGKEGRRGFLSYMRHAVEEFPNYQAQEYELIIDGETIQRKAFLISFANSSQWGNRATIAPQAKIDDGLLNVVILKEFPKYASLPLLLRLFTQSIDHSPYVETFTAKEVTVKNPHYTAHIDGEPCTLVEDITLKVNPRSLKVICN